MTGRKAREECQKLDTDLPFSNQKKKTEILQTSCGKVENHGLEWKPLATIFFKWIYGTSVSATFSAWKTGEPNNPGVENCAYMYVVQKKIGKIIPTWMQCTVFFVRKRSKIIDFSA